MTLCACGAEATANGRECPRHYRERLASLTIGPGASETRTRVDYFDKGALDETFGEDRVDRYWDDTKGAGALNPTGDGRYTHTDWHGNSHVVGQDVADALLAQDTKEVDSSGSVSE